MHDHWPTAVATAARVACFCGIGAAYASLLTTGACTPDCSLDSCWAEVGLEGGICEDGTGVFSDGTETEDGDATFKKCYCPFVDTACADGRTATMCMAPVHTSIESTALWDSVEFSDGASMHFNGGFAECFDYDACDHLSCGNDPGQWMMECSRGTDAYHHTWDGKVFENNRAGAFRYCDGESFEEASEKCVWVIGSCAELNEADCDDSHPCFWVGDDCNAWASTRDCSDHGVQIDCLQDPACDWE